MEVLFWLPLYFTRHKANRLKNNSDNASNQRLHAALAEDRVPLAPDEQREEDNMTEGVRWIGKG